MIRKFLAPFQEDVISGNYKRLGEACKRANYSVDYSVLKETLLWADHCNPSSKAEVAIAVVAGYLDRVSDRQKTLDEVVRPILGRLREDSDMERFVFTLGLLGD